VRLPKKKNPHTNDEGSPIVKIGVALLKGGGEEKKGPLRWPAPGERDLDLFTREKKRGEKTAQQMGSEDANKSWKSVDKPSRCSSNKKKKKRG